MINGSLRLLGSFRLVWEGRELAVGVAAGRALLAYLALAGDMPQAREDLAALLWPGKSSAAAQANLRQTLSRLRAAVPELDTLLRIGEGVITFNRAAVTVDALDFQRLLAEVAAHHHVALADCASCLQRLQNAVELHHGPLLTGLFLADSADFEEWLLLKREQLQQQSIGALALLAENSAALGDFERMRRFAARQIELDPWSEAPRQQLIRALALLDQRQAALEHYETFRLLLERELGVEPTTELQALAAQIRRETAAGSEAQRRHNLPRYLAPLVGRERELARVSAALQHPEAGLLTLTGAGGMGKTRLALEVARALLDSFTDGVFFVALAPLTAPAALPAAIAAAIGLQIGGDAKAALFHALRNQRLLLVLDNFEHLISGAAFVAELLEVAPELKLLVTSREQLDLRGEYVFVVEPLATGVDAASEAPGPALRLFAQAAQRVQPDFMLDSANLSAANWITRLVGGMPLGLELAASWVNTLSVAEIAAEIGASADFLAAEWRDAPERQRSLRAVFDWSWSLLSAAEQQTLAQLAIFRGFSREAAQAVSGASLGLLARLLRKSLLLRSAGPSSGRYEMHEVLRQFALERLERDQALLVAAQKRHSEYYLGFVAGYERRLLHDEPRQATAEIRREVDNVRLAWNWAIDNGELQPLEQCIAAFIQFAWQAGLSAEWTSMAEEGARRIGQQLDQLAPGPARVAQRIMGRLLAAGALRLFHAGEYDAALLTAQRALAFSQAGGGKDGETLNTLHIGQILYRRSDYQQAQQQMRRALELIRRYRASDPDLDNLGNSEWVALIWLNSVNMALGDFAAAARYAEAALELCQREKRSVGELTSLINLTHVYLELRDLAAARRYGELALQQISLLGTRWEEAAIRLELSELARLEGDYEQALTLLEQTQSIATDINAHYEEAIATAYLARLYAFCGDFYTAQKHLAGFWRRHLENISPEDRAQALLAVTQALRQRDAMTALPFAQQARDLAQQYSPPNTQAHTLLILGHVEAALGRGGKACYEQALRLYQDLEQLTLAAEPLAGLAALAWEAGEQSAALARIEAILAILAQHPFAGLDEPFYIYNTCYRILAAAGDPRAATIRQRAERIIAEYAARFVDAKQRRLFLERMSALLTVAV